MHIDRAGGYVQVRGTATQARAVPAAPQAGRWPPAVETFTCRGPLSMHGAAAVSERSYRARFRDCQIGGNGAAAQQAAG
ncbi:MAG: hypothetical protein D6725_17440 [Planctomycetota bacterium]|nr:MAG: hypothetical protein D6725_17440 [Planctomycetota bacterium]